MTPIPTIALLFWSMVLFSATVMISDRRLRVIARTHWKMIALLLVATAVWRIPPGGVFFHGLEYEDSYIYTVAGRQIAERVQSPVVPSTSFSVGVCEVGSIKACQKWEPFPEHLLGYPYVIAEFSRLFGYTPSAGSIVNLLASQFSVLLIFAIALLITEDSVAASVAGFAFASLPVFAVYGLETSAEPFSNFCILVVLLLFLRLCDNDRVMWKQAIMGLAYCVAVCFCMTVKREDFLLAIVLPLTLPFVFAKRTSDGPWPGTPVALVLATSGVAIILILKMHLFQTSEGERELLRQFPFTLDNLARFVASFLSSFLVMGWYEGTFLAVAVGFVVAFMRRGRTVVPVVLLVAYILLYAAHIRSYYEMASGHVEPQAALRFSMNFMGLWAISTGIGIGAVVKWLRSGDAKPLMKRTLLWGTWTVGIAALVVSFVSTVRLRIDAVEDEMISRLVPAEDAASLARDKVGPSGFVVTMEPLVVQMYEDPKTLTVDLETVDVATLGTLLSADSRPHLVLLKEADRITDVDLGRYGYPVRYILSLPSQVLMSRDRFEVVLVGRPSVTMDDQGIRIDK